MRNIEQELKLFLDEREYRILSEQAGALPQLQTNFYFGCQTMGKETMVRIRQKAGSYLLCYKHRMSQTEGVTVCDERESDVTPEDAKRMLTSGIRSDELRQLLGVELDDVYCLGSMDTYRAKFQLQEWTIELDKNVYLGRVDYELECENNDMGSLNKLKNYLYYKFGVVIKPASPKVQRFYDART